MRLIFLCLLFLNQASALECIPKNKFFFPVKLAQSTGISQAEFNDALDQVEKYYAPIIESRGAKLQINRLWEDGTVNSDASQADGIWTINSYGGLARFPGMTKDAYMEVACHEMGHHLGGAPKYPDDVWASDEGEADYFATIRCMKALGVVVKDSRKASLVLAKTLAQLGEEPAPSPKKKDPKVVAETNHDHPQAQCRLDTYLAGVNCPQLGDLSETDPSVNTCFDYDFPMSGERPLCWFKP